MSKTPRSLFNIQLSLQEYYDACAESDEDDDCCWEADENEGRRVDFECPHGSPLLEKTRLSLRHRRSAQEALRAYKTAARRGPNAAAAAALFLKPVNAALVACGSDAGNTTKRPADNTALELFSVGELIFDAFSAVCQLPNGVFEPSHTATVAAGPPLWSLRKRPAVADMWRKIPYSLRTFLEALRTGADDVARLRWLLQALDVVVFRGDIGVMEDAFVDYSQTCTGTEGLNLAARLVLCRLKSVVDRLMNKVLNCVFRLRDECQKFSNSADVLKHNLHHRFENVLLPLRRSIHLLDHACGLADYFQKNETSTTSSGKDMSIVSLASSVMDYLIIRMSALQDSNTMDLYRFYMVILLYCAWPYVLLMTSAIFGFVTEIDADTWRANVPRIFRLSFSHIRPESNNKCDKKTVTFPTDILSLVLLCVGYERGGASDVCNKNEDQRASENRARRRGAFVAMLSARSFILQSFVAFARQKVLAVWSCERSGDNGVPQVDFKSTTEDELYRTTFNRLESWGFSHDAEKLPLCRTDGSLLLALCGDCEDSFPQSQSGCAALYILQADDKKTHHDLLLVDMAEEKGSTCLQLWLHTELPIARWITASLLVPIAQVVQRLHERQLAALLSTAVARSCMEHHYVNEDDNSHTTDFRYKSSEPQDVVDIAGGMDAVEEGANSDAFFFRRHDYLRHLDGGGIPAPTSLAYDITFLDAIKLIIDIALCRDSERIVCGFLRRLLLEPHWWYRRDEAEYKYSGTASSFISTAFSDAISGKPFGQLVRLSVAAKCKKTEQEGSEKNDYALEMLRTFASFELVFSFPWDIELVLLPSTLSIAWGKGDVIEEKYNLYFWKHRRRSETNIEKKRRCEEETATTHAGDTQIKAQDSWSYCFGYLCSLYYAQISLREQRKRLQRRDVDTHCAMAALGTTQQGQRHAVRVTRGLGSAYFELSFAVDSLLNFARDVVCIAARELEEELTKIDAVASCIALCRRVDALFLRLRSVCFPAVADADSAVVAAAEPIRECITSVLAIALDPANLPLRHIRSRTQNAIEALVAVVRALPTTSVLKERMRPLLVSLTFNRFYGE